MTEKKANNGKRRKRCIATNVPKKSKVEVVKRKDAMKLKKTKGDRKKVNVKVLKSPGLTNQ